jgi:hypothetical protein
MNLYYAAGGGLGHLVRAAAVARTLGFENRYALITASQFARAPWVAPQVPILTIPARCEHDLPALRAWLAAVLADAAPERLFVDAFPGGLMGEWSGFVFPPQLELHHVARLLRWAEYRRRVPGPLPRFTRTWLVEPLHADHAQAIALGSARVDRLPLALPPPCQSRAPESDGRPLWLVVHSEPLGEVLELVAYARDVAAIEGSQPRLLVVTPCTLPPGLQCEHLADFSAPALYPHAERIFTAAGFNAALETAACRQRHHVLPFARALDDQFERARRIREARV